LLNLIKLKSTLNHSVMNIKVRDSKYGQDFLRSSFGGSLGLGLWCLRSPKGLGVHAPKRKKSIPPPNGIILSGVRASLQRELSSSPTFSPGARICSVSLQDPTSFGLQMLFRTELSGF
jgi:hypothetical protein